MFAARVVKNPKTAVLELHICQTPKPITVVERSWDDVAGAVVEGDEEGSKKKTLMQLLETDLNIPFNEKPDGPNDLIRVSRYVLHYAVSNRLVHYHHMVNSLATWDSGHVYCTIIHS